MDQTFVASFRKNLESKSTQEIRLACESEDKASKSPEEREAMRQILDERQKKGTRAALALACAVVFGSLGAAWAWWQVGPGAMVFLAGASGAILGLASWYIPNLIPQARV